MAAKGKAAKQYAVKCDKHGVGIFNNLWKAVFVPAPSNGKGSGCPRCQAEAAVARRDSISA